jgi:general secretion pathway protein B
MRRALAFPVEAPMSCAMALRSSREPAPSLEPVAPSSVEPRGRRQWAVIFIAVIAVVAVAAGGAYWLIGEDQKPAAEIATSPEPSAPAAPVAPVAPASTAAPVAAPDQPSKLVTGLPPITPRPTQPVGPAKGN